MKKPTQKSIRRGCGLGRRRLVLAAMVCLLAWGLAASASGGVLTGPIANEGLEAELVDVLQIPESALSRPLARINVLKEAPDGTGRVFINDLRGPLFAVESGAATLYMDLSVERSEFIDSPGLATGFVSFAFHPDFANNGRFYTVHTEGVTGGTPNLMPALSTIVTQHCVLTEWTAIDPLAPTFSGSSRELIRIGAPFFFHNMGEIAFDPTLGPADPDYGLLYVGSGDFGAVHLDESEQLQRLDTPLGAILRIDPLGAPFERGGITYDYAIPAMNPFADDPDPSVLGEIYAFGFRNGHRIAWDVGSANPGPYVSDIGEGNVEELNRLVAGDNYGWPIREGSFALDPTIDSNTVLPLPEGDAGFTYPVAQYDHAEGLAIAGGFVSRAMPPDLLYGQFVFGDIANGRIFYVDASELIAVDDGDSGTMATIKELNLVRNGQPTSLSAVVADALGLPSVNRVDLRFGMDLEGNLFVMTKQDGFVRRLVPVPEPSMAMLILCGVLGVAGLIWCAPS